MRLEENFLPLLADQCHPRGCRHLGRPKQRWKVQERLKDEGGKGLNEPKL